MDSRPRATRLPSSGSGKQRRAGWQRTVTAVRKQGSMDLSKFTEKSQAALLEAQNIATRNQHQAVDAEHIMLALLEQEGGLVARLFERARVAPDLLKGKVEEELNRLPRVSG